MGTNDTINRLVTQSYGVLRNPFFEDQFRAPDNSSLLKFVSYYRRPSSSYGFTNPYPPPWHGFGQPSVFSSAGSGEASLSDVAVQEHPFVKASVFPKYPVPGASLGAFPDTIGGIIQRIPNGRQLLGKKVRITAAFKVQVPDPRVTGKVSLGVSAWLKGAVHEAVIKGTTLRESAGTAVINAGSTTLTDSSATFLSDSLSQGDMIWVSSLSGDEWFEIASVTNDTTLQLKNPAVWDHPGTGDTLYAIGRQAPGGATGTYHGNYINEQGIYVDTAKLGSIPGYFVRATDPAYDYSEGPEWLIQGRDRYQAAGGLKQIAGNDGVTSTTTVTGDTLTSAGSTFSTDIPNTAGTPDVDTWVYLPSQNSWFNVATVVSNTELRISAAASASLPPAGLTAQGFNIVMRSSVALLSQEAAALSFMNGPRQQGDLTARNINNYSVGAYPPYLTTGVTGEEEQTRLFYIDQSDWVTNASGPTYLLAEELVTDTAVHYMDEIVEIPATMTLDTDDLWVVLLPYSPSDHNNIPFPVNVALYAFQIEHIAEEQADASSRLEHAYLKNVYSSRSPYRTRSERELLQDPLYQMVRLPLETRLARPTSGEDLAGVSGTGDGVLDLYVADPIIATDTVVRYYASGGSKTLSPLLIPFPHLPAGSLLEDVRLNFHVAAPGGLDIHVQILEIFERPLNFTPNTTNLVRPVSGTFIATNTGNFSPHWQYRNSQSDLGEFINRHRMGMPWATDDGVLAATHSGCGAAQGEAAGSRWQQSSRYWLILTPQTSGAWDIYLRGGLVRAWVDPRANLGDSGSSS